MNALPKTWEHIPISEVVTVNPRKSVELSGDDLVSFVPMASVDEISGTIALPIDRPYNEVSKGFTHFQDGDVIFAKITPSMENGKSAVARDLTNGTGMGSTEFHVLRTTGTIRPEYLWHYMRQRTFRDDAKEVMSGAVGQQRVPADWLKRHQIPVAPLAEQSRIVAKVDMLAAHTARARKELSRIPALIARYKERILELAFAGVLTADWRNGSGMHSKRTSSSNALWETPKDWKWQRIDEVGDVALGRQRSPENHDGPDMRPYIRAANITWEGVDTSDVKEMNFSAKDFERFQLKFGDVLLNEGSGSAKEVGKPVIWRDEIPNCCYQNTVLRVRPRVCSSEYIYWYFLLTALSARFVDSTKGVNIQHIGKAGLARYMIPVPSSEEQAKIVQRIESAIGSIELIATDHATAERLLTKLDTALLEKAFRGELVPQDPNDEPASALLQRIKAERDATPKKDRARKLRPTTTPREIETMAKNLQEALAEAGGWISAQEAFQRCGIGPSASTEEVEALYAELRCLDKDGKLETEAVNDEQGRKLHDRLRLKAA